MEYKSHTVPVKKSIALVAHDNKKDELVGWAMRHRDELVNHELYATGTTGGLLERHLELPIHKFISGPLGGDQQIGALISDSKLDLLVFFWDPFESQPHDPDVKALLRIAAVWNIPVACNESSADFVFSSPMMKTGHERRIPDYDNYLRSRSF
ncbi:methylglyoxal synthase [Endozoicomonas gorgoniicola]|uniref:Methylglyoxal synthase n=1 Tax=Endozoicomonas gorgoniicola TaxID=1234144 RepID=A0ABT3MQD4_9GAMM|nr:methylglyoxal synthase [Endozoicomonas gorgoniicola]MCW7551575.1 methylglyoxal synthase [Endozoicomonas gorgoniicola]